MECSLGNVPITIAKIKAIKYGTQLCLSLNPNQARIYSNSLDTIQLVYQEVHIDHPCFEDMDEVQDLITNHKDLKLLYAPREAMACVDFLANMAHNSINEMLVIIDPSGECDHLLLFDYSGGFAFISLIHEYSAFAFVLLLASASPSQ